MKNILIFVICIYANLLSFSQTYLRNNNTYLTRINKVLTTNETNLKTILLLKDNDTLYTAYKFNSTKDFITEWAYCMANDLMGFRQLGFNNNSNTFVDKIIYSDPDESIIILDNIDVIGPYHSAVYGYIGANHLFNGNKIMGTNSYDFYFQDSLTMYDNYRWCDSFQVHVSNILYDPAIGPPHTDPLLSEDVIYTVTSNNIEVDLTFQFAKNYSLDQYMGMQMSYTSPGFDSVYFANGQNTNVRLIGDALNSGVFSSYWCDRVILKNNNYNLAMWIDSSGIGATRILDASDYMFYTNTSKIYNQFLGTSTAFLDGSTYNWKGVYTLFENISDKISFSYIMKFDGDDYLFLDWHQQVTDTLNLIGFSTHIINRQVGNISLNWIADDSLRIVTSSDYGFVKLLLN